VERRGEVAVLGPLSVVGVDGQVSLGAGRARWVLAALALARGAVVSAAELIRVLWPDEPPPGARNTLQTHVADLRRRRVR